MIYGNEIIQFLNATELTIASDAITITQGNHKLQPQSGTADNLSTINGTTQGQFGILYASDFGVDTITIKHNVGNILCVGGSDITLSNGCVFWYSNGTKVFMSGGGGGSSSATVPYSIGGRITLQSGVAVMTTTQAAKTTIYWTPYNGQIVPIYDGTNMVPTDVGGELSQATTDNTKSPAAVATNSNYDLFIWNDGGTYRCTRGPAWTSATARGTGAGTTELELIKGIHVNKVAITNGPAAQRGTYVGTVRSNGSSQIDYIFAGSAGGGTAGFIGVWNKYNRVNVEMAVHDTTANWSFSSATVGPLNPGAAGSGLNNRISYIVGLSEDSIDLRMYCRGRTAAVNGSFMFFGIGIDSTTVISAVCTILTLSATQIEAQPTCFGAPVQLGFHYAQMLQAGDGTNTSNMYGASDQNGLVVNSRF